MKPVEVESKKEDIENKQPHINKEIKSIHETAQTIIKLQAVAKEYGGLNNEEEKIYNENLEQLNLAAKNLASVQQTQAEDDQDIDELSRANLQFWFEQKRSKLWSHGHKENKEEETTQGAGGTVNNGDEEPDDDGVAINLPPEDASVAEAKPVGLAVAGIYKKYIYN